MASGALLGGSFLLVLLIVLLPSMLFFVAIWRIGTGTKGTAAALWALAEMQAREQADRVSPPTSAPPERRPTPARGSNSLTPGDIVLLVVLLVAGIVAIAVFVGLG